MNMDINDKNQQGKSTLFEARDPSPTYKGAERRREHRRKYKDRRVEMRFEMDKPDRRVCPGRRADDAKAKLW